MLNVKNVDDVNELRKIPNNLLFLMINIINDISIKIIINDFLAELQPRWMMFRESTIYYLLAFMINTLLIG